MDFPTSKEKFLFIWGEVLWYEAVEDLSLEGDYSSSVLFLYNQLIGNTIKMVWGELLQQKNSDLGGFFGLNKD